MNAIKRGVLIGLVLGDGHLRVCRDKRFPNSWHSEFSVTHRASQKEYIEYKAKLLHSILGGKLPKVSLVNNNGKPGYKIYKSHRYFRVLHGWIYKNGRKCFTEKILRWLTPQGIALWYMDNGCLSAKRRNGKVHAYELTLNTYVSEEENRIIAEYFAEAYGIVFTVSKSHGSYRIRCGTKEAKKFIELIRPYIIPCMEYKVAFKK